MKNATRKSPEEILDGDSLRDDLGMLIGYAWGEGNRREEMPSCHFLQLMTYLENKHNLRVE